MRCETILPTNIDEAINALDLLACVRLFGVKEQAQKIENFSDALKIDEAFLSIIIDEYEAGMFREYEPDMRRLVSFAQKNYAKLGTISAIKKVFEALKIDAEIKEWFQTGKEPFIFDLDLSLTDKEITPKLIEKLKKLVTFAKNARSRLDELQLSYKQTQNTALATGGVGEVSCMTEVLEGYEETLKGLQNLSIGGVGEASSYAVMEA